MSDAAGGRCPLCGWGQLAEVRIGAERRPEAYYCLGCRRIFIVPEMRVVIYQRVRCPACASTRTRVTSSPTRRIGGNRIRYHVCEACREHFKSVEPGAVVRVKGAPANGLIC